MITEEDSPVHGYQHTYNLSYDNCKDTTKYTLTSELRQHPEWFAELVSKPELVAWPVEVKPSWDSEGPRGHGWSHSLMDVHTMHIAFGTENEMEKLMLQLIAEKAKQDE